jgi:hypothetical protein
MKQLRALLRLSPVLLFALIFLAAGPARAACSGPTGAESNLTYNNDYHTYQFCNGTSWVTAGQIGAAASLTFGETNVLSNGDSSNKNLLLAQSATLSGAGTIQSLSFYVTTAAGNLRLGIYDATGPSGGPGNLLAQTASFAPTTGWNTANVVTPVALAAGTYWLAYDPSSNSLSFVNDGGVSGGCKDYAFTFGSLPATFSTTPSNCGPGHWSFYATITNPVCSNPSGVEDNIVYNKDYHTLQYCNGAAWYPLGTGSGGSSGNCSNPTGSAGNFTYNKDYHTFQYCNGTNWVKFGGGSLVTLPGSSDGYFVMSKSTWTGNLGGFPAADGLCLTDLTTNTGWRGYADASTRGLLTSGHVHAFLCGGANYNCNNLNPGKTYYFADANNSANGGASFTTGGIGLGPNDSANWSDVTHFGATYSYWTNRGDNSSNTAWQESYAGNDCGVSGDWNNATSGHTGSASSSIYSDYNRWYGYTLTPTCNTQEHLICNVDPCNYSWTPETAASANTWDSVAYGNGLFAAVSTDGHVMTSPDGITWTSRTAASASTWNAVTYGNGLFVAVAFNGNVMTSPDGITWTSRTAAEANGWNGVTYGNGQFVAVASTGTHRVMTSPDGITWTARTAASANTWNTVAYGNSVFVASDTTGGANHAMTSPDGITWTSQTAPGGGIAAITFGNGLFIGVSNDHGASSPDGVTWTGGGPNYPVYGQFWLNAAYGNGLFVATSQSGTGQVMISSDGMNWFKQAVPEANTWDGIAYGNGVFVAVSSDGTHQVMIWNAATACP